ncbi:MAG: hypothetical protein IT365_08880 [Candidatus Hydrogenedentes bacterium]|nr:hypothetical protein [Candidatus Hydrogenedentota bacterium]
MKWKMRSSAAIPAFWAALLLFPSCPNTTPMQIDRDRAQLQMETMLIDKARNTDFASEVKRITSLKQVKSLVIERPAYDGTTVMKIAVLYPGTTPDAPMCPVAIMPGFTAGGFLYLEYACSLAQAGYAVFVPDVQGDYIHFIGVELFQDPLIRTDIPALRANFQSLKLDLEEYTGTDDIDAKEAFALYKQLYAGIIDDQQLADIFRDNLFAYRSYSLDIVVTSMFDVDADEEGPLFELLDTDHIGLEGHSFGPDEVLEAVAEKDGAPRFWWSGHIKVALLKGALTALHRAENFQTIQTPVIFMNGEYDDELGVLQPTWTHYNEVAGPAGFIKVYGSGHMFFIDPPIGFLGEKFLPFWGDFEKINLRTFRKNRVVLRDLCVLVYDAYLKEDPGASQALKDTSLDFDGECYTRNM